MSAQAHTVVKICGLTCLADARAARSAGADWLGFVLKGESPRRIAAELAGEITAALGEVTTVAVLVDPSPDEALKLAATAGADRIQLHRVDASRWPEDFPLPVSIVVPVAEDGSLTEPLPADRYMVLLDTAHPRLAGGTGERFPWETARVVAATRRVLLAGGLDPSNVAEAMRRVHPFGVDASSGLESSPGRKDEHKVRLFVETVRRCDERLDQLA